MRFLYSLFSFSFSSLLIFFSPTTASNIINDTCTKAANPNLHYSFCITSLQADPNSHNATLQKLGLISINLSLSNMTYVQSTIQNLLNNQEGDPDVKSNLQACYQLYTNAIPDLHVALSRFNKTDYAGANMKLDVANEAALDCELGFKIKGLASPLRKENDNCFQLTAICQAIIYMFDS